MNYIDIYAIKYTQMKVEIGKKKINLRLSLNNFTNRDYVTIDVVLELKNINKYLTNRFPLDRL